MDQRTGIRDGLVHRGMTHYRLMFSGRIVRGRGQSWFWNRDPPGPPTEETANPNQGFPDVDGRQSQYRAAVPSGEHAIGSEPADQGVNPAGWSRFCLEAMAPSLKY